MKNYKLKLLKLSLHYVLPKFRSTETTEKKQEGLPLFIGVSIVKRYR